MSERVERMRSISAGLRRDNDLLVGPAKAALIIDEAAKHIAELERENEQLRTLRCIELTPKQEYEVLGNPVKIVEVQTFEGATVVVENRWCERQIVKAEDL